MRVPVKFFGLVGLAQVFIVGASPANVDTFDQGIESSDHQPRSVAQPFKQASFQPSKVSSDTAGSTPTSDIARRFGNAPLQETVYVADEKNCTIYILQDANEGNSQTSPEDNNYTLSTSVQGRYCCKPCSFGINGIQIVQPDACELSLSFVPNDGNSSEYCQNFEDGFVGYKKPECVKIACWPTHASGGDNDARSLQDDGNTPILSANTEQPSAISLTCGGTIGKVKHKGVSDEKTLCELAHEWIKSNSKPIRIVDLTATLPCLRFRYDESWSTLPKERVTTPPSPISQTSSTDAISLPVVSLAPRSLEKRSQFAMVCLNDRSYTVYCSGLGYYCSTAGVLQGPVQSEDPNCATRCECVNLQPKPICIVNLIGTSKCLRKREDGTDHWEDVPHVNAASISALPSSLTTLISVKKRNEAAVKDVLGQGSSTIATSVPWPEGRGATVETSHTYTLVCNDRAFTNFCQKEYSYHCAAGGDVTVTVGFQAYRPCTSSCRCLDIGHEASSLVSTIDTPRSFRRQGEGIAADRDPGFVNLKPKPLCTVNLTGTSWCLGKRDDGSEYWVEVSHKEAAWLNSKERVPEPNDSEVKP